MNDLPAPSFSLFFFQLILVGMLPAQQTHEPLPRFTQPAALEVRGGEGVYALGLAASGCWLSVQQDGTEKLFLGHWEEEGTLRRAQALFEGETGQVGALALFPGGRRAVLTRSLSTPSHRGIVELGLFFVERDSTGWKHAEAFPFNDPAFSNLHPALSSDGKALVFASNRPGGFGGFDLYVCFFRNGRWTRPVNLGSEINSDANEAFPFLAPGGKLYFASDAPTSQEKRHFDLFFAIPNDGGFWSEKRPLGKPFNSPSDDFNFLQTPTQTFFSSNRNGSDRLFQVVFPPED